MAAPVVFISSTVRDLVDLRGGVGYVLRQRGASVVMSDTWDFPLLGNQSAIEECFENIRNSDLYVLIVDKTRGTLYADDVSMTRQELRVARESFTSTGKPHQLLFARRGARELARRRNKALIAAGVDDPQHFRSFMKEIMEPENPSVPNFLKEFGSFEEIMDPILARLNLGRNFAESLVRRSVFTELTRNLAYMVTRAGTRASVKHFAINSISDEFDFQQLPHAGTVDVTERQRTRLIMGTLGRVKASALESDAIHSAVIGGVFLDYNATEGTLVETKTHQVLAQVLDDLSALAVSDVEDWDKRILTDLVTFDSHRVSVFDLMVALSFGARAENLFNQMLKACWLLTGSPNAELPIQRLPTTPMGPDEDLKIRREQVEAWEVEQLLLRDIHPFGARISSELAKGLEVHRVEQAMEMLKGLKVSNPDLDIGEAALRSIAEKVVREATADPGDGLSAL